MAAKIKLGLQLKQRGVDLFVVFLLFAALLTAASQLQATRWSDYLYINLTIVMIGGIVGIAAGASRFRVSTVSLLVIAYGAITILWQLGLTISRELPWNTRLSLYWGEISEGLLQIINNESVRTYYFFLTLMAVLYWVLSSLAGYMLVRQKNEWAVVLPTGLTMMVINVYGYTARLSPIFLASYIFFALVLVARITYLKRFGKWQHSRIHLPLLINLDMARVAVLTAGLLVFSAWTIPAVAASLPPAEEAWEIVSKPWQFLKDRFESIFDPLQPSVATVQGYYDSSMSLGRGNPLSEDPVLSIEAPRRPSAGVRYYWRGRTYDHYENGEWTSTLTTVRGVAPNEFNLTVPQYTDRWYSVVQVTSHQLMSTLLTPAQPEWVSAPSIAEFGFNPDDTVDIAAIHASPQLTTGQTYLAQSAMADYTVMQLREAGTEYPDWVVERHLQLPETISDRTAELAEQITIDLNNPYDKASAITQFLRVHLTYSVSLPRIPADQDPVDWVLFDLQEAFCNYYATAEVVMLRSLGIPARLAVGYSQGENVTPDDLLSAQKFSSDFRIPHWLESQGPKEYYLVKEKNSHSWPEVYFPDYGWVEFEPTGNQEPLLRPLGIEEVEDASPRDPFVESPDEILEEELLIDDELIAQKYDRLRGLNEDQPKSAISNIPWWVIATPLAALLVAVVWFLIRRKVINPIPVVIESGFQKMNIQPPGFLSKWSRYAKLSPIEKSYLEINRALRRVGVQPELSLTPGERVFLLNREVPDLMETAQLLLQEYQKNIYSTQRPDLSRIRPAAALIRKMSRQIMFNRLKTLGFFRNQEKDS